MNTLPTFRAELQKVRRKYAEERLEQLEALYTKHNKSIREICLLAASKGADHLSYKSITRLEEHDGLYSAEIKFILRKLGISTTINGDGELEAILC